MNDKPKMYHGEIRKNINNNRSIYTSYNNKKHSKVNDINNIRKKLDNIFDSSTFIYRRKVNIIIDGKLLTKKIIGEYNDNLVTIDNERIPINLIEDIYI